MLDLAPLSSGARITLRRNGPLALIQLFNPSLDVFDSISEHELSAALDLLDTGVRPRVVVLTGATPGVFVRHYDVVTLHQTAQRLRAKGVRFSPERPIPASPFQQLVERIASAPWISIAAINGTAMGGGLELAMACDIRVAQMGNHRLGLPEIRAGVIPGSGGTQRLTRLIGSGPARYYMLTGSTFGPAEALRMGLVSECVDDALARSLSLAADLSDLPERASTHIKHLVQAAECAEPLETALPRERTLFCDCLVDDNALPKLEAVAIGKVQLGADPQISGRTCTSIGEFS